MKVTLDLDQLLRDGPINVPSGFNRGWALNLAAGFGGIHFYTQWFDHFGADPSTILFAGLLTLAAAIGLRQINRHIAAAP